MGAASLNGQSLSILNDVSDELHKNVNALAQYMDLYNLPSSSRNALNEVLHGMKTTVENEGAILDRDIVDYFVHWMLVTGRIPPVVSEFQLMNALGKGKKANVAPSGDKFVFDPSKYSAQKRPSKEAQICYDCANAMFRAGQMKEGENPPAKVWFGNYTLLMQHKALKKCGN